MKWRWMITKWVRDEVTELGHQLLHMCRAEYRMSLRANTWTLGKDSFTNATEVAGMPKFNLATTGTVVCLNWLVRHNSNGSLSVYIGLMDHWATLFGERDQPSSNSKLQHEFRMPWKSMPARRASARQLDMHILANRSHSKHAGGKNRFIGFVGFFYRFSVFCRFLKTDVGSVVGF